MMYWFVMRIMASDGKLNAKLRELGRRRAQVSRLTRQHKLGRKTAWKFLKEASVTCNVFR
jgi:hypothetical protein